MEYAMARMGRRRLRAMWIAGAAALALGAALAFGCGSQDSTPDGPADSGAENAGPGDTGTPATPSDAGVESAAGDAGDAAPPTPVNVTQPCSNGLKLQVSLLDDGVARFHYVEGGVPQPDRGWTYDLSQFHGAHAPVVQQTATTLNLRTSAIDVTITGATCSISIASVPSGEVLWSESSPFTREADGGVSLGRTLASNEAIYGLGEKNGPGNRVGNSYVMWNTDEGCACGDPIYQSHPYFLSLPASGHASGAYVANTHEMTFDVGSASATSLAMSAVGGDIDLFFFDGPMPAAVIEEYTRLVGRQWLPPLWTLGYHQSRWTYSPESYFEQVAATFRSLGLPADGMWLDIDYMNGFRDFTWDPSAFSDPAAVVATVTGEGFHITNIVDPGVKYDPGGTYATYNAGVEKGMFYDGDDGGLVLADCWPGAAAFPDFTNPAVRTWWAGQIADFMSIGTSGIWNDMNEPSVFTNGGVFPLDTPVNGDGVPTTFSEAKNVYGLLEAKAAQQGELTAFPNNRPFVLTRAGFSGIQKYSAVWTGDSSQSWDQLVQEAPMLQGLGVSGVPFVGSDVGGFIGGGPSPELYGRWFEVGAFSPFFRTHTSTTAPPQEPWDYGPEIQFLAQQMLDLRYSILPYLYESFIEANTAGTPVMRPLWYGYPSDPQTQSHLNEWFFGDSLLVATVLAPLVTQLDVYIPTGVFQDFYTGAAYTGPTTVTLPAPLGRIPLLVRGGSVIPELDVQQYVGAVPDVAHHLDVYPGAAGTTTQATLHEDDGESLDYAKGGQSTVTVSLDVTATGLTLALGARTGGYTPPVAARSHDIRVHGVGAQPTSVKVNGATVNATWSDDTRLLVIPIADYKAAQTVTVTYPAAPLPPPRKVSLSFNVTLPPSTPAGATVYVASSVDGWGADGQALTTSGGVATGTMIVPEGALVWYVMTLGDWRTVEVASSCAQVPDREVIATANTTVSIAVSAWASTCPTYSSAETPYSFGTGVNPSSCMDISGGAAAAGTQVDEYSCNQTAAQAFVIEDAGAGAMYLYNSNSMKCVEVAGGGNADGTQIEIDDCNQMGSQTFVFQDAGAGFVNIVNTNSSKCLDVSGGSPGDGTAVQLYHCNQTPAQQWKLISSAFQPSAN
jgi:alpha-glucosidase